AALDHRPLGPEIKRHDGDVLEMNVGPHVELGPVGEREHAHALARPELGVGKMPELWPLALGIPIMRGVAEREHALLGARLFLIAPRAAERRIEVMAR